jgi:sugar lactone lactonase YvrE
MEQRKILYSFLVLAVGLLLGLLVESHFVPEKSKDGLAKETLPDKYKYNIEEYKKVDSGLVIYREIKAFKTGFTEAAGLAIDKNDKIFICGDKGVRIVDPNGILLNEIISAEKITAVAVSGEGVIYAAARDRIFFGKKDFSRDFGKRGRGKGDFEYITGLKTGGDKLFIADAGNRKVTVADLQGKFIADIGGKDAAKGIKGFIVPSPHMDLDIDKVGNIWVANTGLLRLEKYSVDGVLAGCWGKAGAGLDAFIGCCNPSNFVIDKNGDFVTSEKGLPRIKLYDMTGKLKGVVAPPSEFNEKCVYMALAVDSKNRVFALDSVKKMVRVFEKKQK